MMRTSEVKEMLDKARRVRVAVIGDFCLDVYWFIDDTASELSLETGLPTQPIREQRYSLGGAGNVVANIVALGACKVHCLGVLGADPWGRTIDGLLAAGSVDTGGMIVQAEGWATPAYTKPHVGKEERSRLDFGNFNRLSNATADRLLQNLEMLLPELDVVVVNQQLRNGIHTPAFRERLAGLIRRKPETIFIVDSRHYSEYFPGAWLKINDHEAARLCGIQRVPEALVLKHEAITAANTLFDKLGQPIFVTRGNRGCLVRDRQGLHEIPGIQIMGPTDTVGAGDALLSGIALSIGAGHAPSAAAALGNFVAAVTVGKLNQTGTATPAEVLALVSDAAYVFEPELAEDIRQARYLPETEFEIVTTSPAGRRITHAIFDHDGTISSLRQGWEQIMEPMMVRAILGPKFAAADESLYLRVLHRVRDYIDQSTGIQTVVQMQDLVKMVREFECVPPAEILDAAGYKRIYNAELLSMVRSRLAKLERGELAADDFIIKGAAVFLEALSRAGVRLHLASGTDQEDVIAEARGLGYATLFKGGIHGSIGDIARDAKRVVLDRILDGIGSDRVGGLVMFGDGPVEIREMRRRGGLAIGVASDELRRFGLNPVKRTRLIRAGAEMIIPDFSQSRALLKLLGIA